MAERVEGGGVDIPQVRFQQFTGPPDPVYHLHIVQMDLTKDVHVSHNISDWQKMRNIYKNRSSLNFRQHLIDLNITLDFIKSWTEKHGFNDHFSTITFLNINQSSNIINDIILLEDRRFFRHRGFDIWSIPRGLKRLVKFGKIGGISTIDQLLVRTCLQRQERTLTRKMREITLSILLNFHHSKAIILVAYINCAYFGPRLHGADTASRIVFGVSACELTSDQSAFLASLLPYPLPTNVVHNLRQNGPCSDPGEILQKFELSNPWWSSRVRSRIVYLENLRLRYLAIS